MAKFSDYTALRALLPACSAGIDYIAGAGFITESGLDPGAAYGAEEQGGPAWSILTSLFY